jgi:aldehyde dehydrogenase (NAD+)
MGLVLVHPYTQRAFAELAYDTPEELDAKLERARAAFDAWRALPLAERKGYVARGMERFRREREEIARELTMQTA